MFSKHANAFLANKISTEMMYWQPCTRYIETCAAAAAYKATVPISSMPAVHGAQSPGDNPRDPECKEASC